MEQAIAYPSGAQEVAHALAVAGFECFAVGGCVRDSLMGRAPADWDFTTNATTDEMKRCFDAAHIHWASTGERHGTLTAIVAEETFEVTTYRVESSYSDGRHPDKVIFSRTLGDDLSRRDFTVNAMAYAPKAGIVDLFGGQADLMNHMVRAVGCAHERFEEDGLRIMRALRFAAVLDFAIELKTAQALHECRENLSHVSVERIFSELSRFLLAEDGKRVAELMREFPDVLAPILFSDDAMSTNEQNGSAWENAATLVAKTPPDLAVRFAALFVGLFAQRDTASQGDETAHAAHAERAAHAACAAHDMLRKLKSPKRLASEVSRLVGLASRSFTPTALGARRLIAACGSEAAVSQLLMLYRAQGRAHVEELEALAREQAALGAPFSLKDLAIKGDDLIQLGMPSGSEIGSCLNGLFEQVVEGNVANEKSALRSLFFSWRSGISR